MPRRVTRRSSSTPQLPPVLVRLIHAANEQSATGDLRGHGSVLAESAAWALVSVPARGVLAPREGAAFGAIQAIAARHLGHSEASRAFQRALDAIGDRPTANEIESTANHLQSINDDAYYYVGLACGLVLASLAAGE